MHEGCITCATTRFFRMVFSDRKFIIIRDNAESIEKHDALANLITSHNGEIVNWDERADIDVSPKLIIVSSTMDYDRAEEMKRFMIPTVTPRWIHFCIKEQKLVPTRPFSPDPRNFMRDIIACFSGLTSGDTDVFKAGILASGGECTEMVTRYTTHVVATSLDTPECELVLQSRINNPQIGIKLVKPDWVDACMSLQAKVDDSAFLLDPPRSGSDGTQPSALPGDASQQLTQPTQDLTATFPISDSPRLAVQQSMREALGSNTLDGRRFFLGDDLDLSKRVGKTVTYLIETNGGVIVNDLNQAQVYLGKWREGDEYITASRRKIIIGNITWLYWMMIHQHFEKPTHLLHYPEVKGGLPLLRNCNICVTNYTGDARAYLQSLIHSLGANYSGKLIEKHTTHLITAYESGQKYEAAKKWGIPVVNHLWLEDTYAYWQPQDPSSRVYTYFPAKLSMSTLIGTRNLVGNVLSKFQNPHTEFSKAPHPKRQAKQKAGNWLHDAMIVENEFHKNLKRGRLPIDAIDDTTSGHINDTTNNDRETSMSAEPEPRETTPNQLESNSVSGTPKSDTPKSDTPKSGTPKSGTPTPGTSTPGTSGTSKPGTSTSEIPTSEISISGTSDIQNRPKNTPKPDIGTLDTPEPSDIPSSSSRATTPTAATSHRNEPEKYRIMFSGVDEPPSNKACSKIGLSVVKTTPAKVLIAPKFMKTAKFLQCLAETEEFVTPGWVTACIRGNTLLPTDKYRIRDEALSVALHGREALNGRKLFEGLKFRLAPDLRDQTVSFKSFVKAHGGSLATRSESDGVLIIGNESPDVPWTKFIESMQLMDPSVLSTNI